MTTNQPNVKIQQPIAGIRVTADPEMRELYTRVKQLAQKKNYWAQQIVTNIESLSAGRGHKNNIFVNKSEPLDNNRGEFHVIVPGCKITLNSNTDGTYSLIALTPDTTTLKDYLDLQNDFEKPGLYQMKFDTTEQAWKKKYIQGQGITEAKDGRYVIVADRSSYPVVEVTGALLHWVKDVVTESTLKKYGFDLHYTPGMPLKQNLRRANPEYDPNWHDSSILLAKTMYDARNIENVTWVSEWGGSAPLTQAMTILASQSVKLTNQSIFLCSPLTDATQALSKGRAIGLEPDGEGYAKAKGLEGWVARIGIVGDARMKLHRLKHDKAYGIKNVMADMFMFATNKMASFYGLLGTGAALGVKSVAAFGTLNLVATVGAYFALFMLITGTVMKAFPKPIQKWKQDLGL